MSDQKLIESIELSNRGFEPLPFGELTISIAGSPASVQSSKNVKSKYLGQIKHALSKYKFLLTGPLFLDVTWLISAKSRYETDAKADIDNCIKPIIDAFVGPDGLFIDDCQLKGLYICWRHIDSGEERLDFEFRFDPIQWCNKSHLAFVRLDNALCTFVDTTWPKPIKRLWVEAMRVGQESKKVLEQLNLSYLAVTGLLGGSQPFHRSRTNGFPVFSPDAFIEDGIADA